MLRACSLLLVALQCKGCCTSPSMLVGSHAESCPFSCQFYLVHPDVADMCLATQARIVGLNAQYFLKNGGFYVISIKASCIDSTAQPEAVFAREVKKLSEMLLKPKEQVTLEPYERDHAMVVGVYRPPPKAKAAA